MQASSSANFAAKMRQKTEMILISLNEFIFEYIRSRRRTLRWKVLSHREKEEERFFRRTTAFLRTAKYFKYSVLFCRIN